MFKYLFTSLNTSKCFCKLKKYIKYSTVIILWGIVISKFQVLLFFKNLNYMLKRNFCLLFLFKNNLCNLCETQLEI